MTAERPDYVHTQRELGIRGGVLDFARMAWPIVEPSAPFIEGWHVGAVGEHLEALFRYEISDLVINIPPSHMKSLLASVFFPVWTWVQDPGWRSIHVSYGENLAIRDARKHLAIVQSDWFKSRWGDRVTLPKDVVAVHNFDTLQGGFRFSCSIGGQVTGRHADIATLDDPHKPLDISSNSLDTVEEFLLGTLPSRYRNMNRRRRAIIMQRLHERDASAVAERMGATVLRLPLRYEPHAASYTSVGGDPRTTAGELLWPERMSLEAAAALEESLGGATSRNAVAQLQQRPSAEGGSVFKRSWFRSKPVAGVPVHWDLLIQSWDCSFKDESTSDFVAGGVWGMSKGEIWLLECLNKRLDFPDTCAEILATRARWPGALGILVEDKANGTAVIQTLRKKVPGLIAIEPQGGKVARANAVAPAFESGSVYTVDADAPGYGWVRAWQDQLATFPVGKNDDMVDMTSQAVHYLVMKRSALSEAMAKVKALGGAENFLNALTGN